MATQTELKNRINGNGKNGIVSVEEMIKRSVVTLGQALPKHMNAERLVRIALTTMRLNPELYKCTPESFMGALFQSAQLGLEPNVEGQAYIIPFNNKKKIGNEWKSVKEAQFQIGYKGYVELFYRHSSAVSLDMQKVREGDEFDFQYGTESYLKHKPSWDGGEVRGYYAVAKMANGGTIFKYMTKEECLDHGRQHSKCVDRETGEFFKNTPWAKDTDAMCMKTVLIQLMKLLPKSIELQKAISADETIKTHVAADMFDVKDATNWEDSPEDAEVTDTSKESVKEAARPLPKKKPSEMSPEELKAEGIEP